MKSYEILPGGMTGRAKESKAYEIMPDAGAAAQGLGGKSGGCGCTATGTVLSPPSARCSCSELDRWIWAAKSSVDLESVFAEVAIWTPHDIDGRTLLERIDAWTVDGPAGQTIHSLIEISRSDPGRAIDLIISGYPSLLHPSVRHVFRGLRSARPDNDGRPSPESTPVQCQALQDAVSAGESIAGSAFFDPALNSIWQMADQCVNPPPIGTNPDTCGALPPGNDAPANARWTACRVLWSSQPWSRGDPATCLAQVRAYAMNSAGPRGVMLVDLIGELGYTRANLRACMNPGVRGPAGPVHNPQAREQCDRQANDLINIGVAAALIALLLAAFRREDAARGAVLTSAIAIGLGGLIKLNCSSRWSR